MISVVFTGDDESNTEQIIRAVAEMFTATVLTGLTDYRATQEDPRHWKAAGKPDILLVWSDSGTRLLYRDQVYGNLAEFFRKELGIDLAKAAVKATWGITAWQKLNG